MSKKSTFNKIIGDIDKSLDENLESYKEIKRNLKETFGKEKSDENIKEDKDILFCTKCGAEMEKAQKKFSKLFQTDNSYTKKH